MDRAGVGGAAADGPAQQRGAVLGAARAPGPGHLEVTGVAPAALGQQLAADVPSARHQIDIFILAASLPGMDKNHLKDLAHHIDSRLEAACAARQRTAHDS